MDALTQAIYDTALEPARMRYVLADIARVVHAAGAAIVAFARATGRAVLSAIAGVDAERAFDYHSRYTGADPLARHMIERPQGVWVRCDEAPSAAQHGFAREFLVPCGFAYTSAVKVLDTSRFVAVLIVHRTRGQGPLPDQAHATLDGLLPHLARALRLVLEQAELESQSTLARSALDALDYAALLCDRHTRVLVANIAAEELLRGRDGLHDTSGRLHIRDARARAGLHCVLQGESAGMVIVPRPSGLASFQLIASPMGRDQGMLALDSDDLWTLVISDPARASVPTLRAVSLLFGLTPAEARVADLLLAGESPRAIAVQLGVSLATIRTQLRALFAKTGTRRQAEFIQLFGSVPPLRDGPETLSHAEVGGGRTQRR